MHADDDEFLSRELFAKLEYSGFPLKEAGTAPPTPELQDHDATAQVRQF